MVLFNSLLICFWVILTAHFAHCTVSISPACKERPGENGKQKTGDAGRRALEHAQAGSDLLKNNDPEAKKVAQYLFVADAAIAEAQREILGYFIGQHLI